MVLFLTEKGENYFESIGYTIWPFVLVLLENGKHAIIAIPAIKGLFYHENCRRFLKRFRPDLKVAEEKGKGVITVYPKGICGSGRAALFFCKSIYCEEPDWNIVERLIREYFPEAGVHHYPK